MNFSSVTFNTDFEPPKIITLTPANNSYYNSDVFVNSSVVDSSNATFGFVDNKLISWFRMDDLNSSGGIVDYFGRNNGTPSGGASQVANSKFGKAMSFDGSNDYIIINPAGSASVKDKTQQSISFWIYWNTVLTNQVLYEDGTSGDYWRYTISTYNGDALCGPTQLRFSTRDLSSGDSGTRETLCLHIPTAGQWYHYVSVYDNVSGTKQFYINGALYNSTTSSVNQFTSSSTAYNFIGADSTGRYFNGTLDEVLIFNRSLTSDEVLALYNSSANRILYNFTSDNFIQGRNNISLYASDSVGNVNLSVVAINYDTLSPKINVSIPENKTYYNAGIINFTANSTDSNNVSLFMNLDNKLVSWFRMDDSTGTTVIDYMGRYNGTASGASQIDDGKFGKGMSFRGGTSYDYLSFPTNSMDGFRTFEFWFKPSSIASGVRDWTTNALFFNNGDNTLDNEFAVHLYNSTTISAGWGSAGYENDVTYSGISTGNWYQVVVSVNDTDASLYINGDLKSYKTADPQLKIYDSISGPQFGHHPGAYIGFNGTIDDVMIFNRSISATEVKSLYSNSSTKYYNETMNLSEGPHTLTMYTQDFAGNINSSFIKFGVDYNFTQINFVYPTYVNGASTIKSSYTANATISELNLTSVNWNWNGTNYTIYNDSLFLMYNFENLSSLGENSTLVVDLSKYSRNGTVVNTNATWNSSGKYGGGYTFDNTTEILTFSAISTPTYYTISSWVFFPLAVSGSWRTLVSHNGGTYHHILWNSSGGMGIYNSVWYPCGYEAGSLTGWHQITSVKNNSGLTGFYVDGVYVGASNSQITTSDISAIGNYNSGGGQQVGTIDEFRIWNRSLSAAEINASYYYDLKKHNFNSWSFSATQNGLTSGNYSYFVSTKNSRENEILSDIRNINVGGRSYALLNLSWVYPLDNINVYKGRLFNITFNITCLNTTCGDVNLSLDPSEGRLKDALVVDHGQDKTYLTRNGYTYDTISETAFGSVTADTLLQYEMIIIEPNWNNYNYLRSALPAIQDALNTNKLVVSIRVAGNGGNQADIDFLGTDYDRTNTYNAETFVDSGHMFITGSDCCTHSLLTSYFDSWGSTDHGILYNRPTGERDYKEILQDSGGISMFEYKYGMGLVLVDTLTSIDGGWGSGNDNVADNYINYMAYMFDNGGLGGKGLISTTRGAIPFYTNDSNPRNITLNLNESKLVTFFVNATSSGKYEFFAFANQTMFPDIGFESSRFNITVKKDATSIVSLISPVNEYFQSNTQNTTLNFSCNAVTLNVTDAGLSLVNVTLYIWNQSKDLIITNTSTSSLLNYTANFTQTLPKGNGYYEWNCLATNTWNQSYFASTNNSIGINLISGCMDLNESNREYTLMRSISSTGNCFNINANNVSINLNGYTITGPGSSYGIYNNGYNNTKVINGQVISYGYGIYLASGIRHNLTNVNVSSNKWEGIYLENINNSFIQGCTANLNVYWGMGESGIYLYQGSNNRLINNTANHNGYYGIQVYYGSNNTLINNTMYSNDDYYVSSGTGLYIYNCYLSNLSGNNISGNPTNLVLGGDSDLYFNNKIDNSNLLDSFYPIYYNYSISNYVYDQTSAPNAGTIMCAKCNNVTVKNLNISNHASYGVYFFNTSNSKIYNSTLDSYYGAYIRYGGYNNLSNIYSTLPYSRGYMGIYLEYTNYTNLSNIVSNNKYYGLSGYYIGNSRFQNISTSNITGYGLDFEYCSNNNFTDIKINSSSYGIQLYNSERNNVINSSINFTTSAVSIYYSQLGNYFENLNVWNCTTTSSGCLNVYYSSSNAFDSVYLNNSAKYGIFIQGSSGTSVANNNVFQDVKIENTPNAEDIYLYEGGSSQYALNERFLNATYTDTLLTGDGVSLMREWYADFNITNSSGSISGANISLYKNTGVNATQSALSNDTAYRRFNVTIYNQTATSTYNYYNNYTLRVTKNRYFVNSSSINVTTNQVYNISLMLDNIVPVTSLIYPPNSMTNSSRNMTFSWNVTDSGTQVLCNLDY